MVDDISHINLIKGVLSCRLQECLFSRQTFSPAQPEVRLTSPGSDFPRVLGTIEFLEADATKQ